MSGILDPGDQRIVARYLNDVNDAAPGVPVSTAQASGSIIQPYFGMVGKRLVCTYAMANDLSDTTIGQLYEGIYQYVQTRAGSTAAPARGALCYWDDYENYIVSPDVSASATNPFIGHGPGANSGLFAGVYLSAPTKGNYCFIQIAGKASVLFKQTITNTTPAAGDFILSDGTTSATADDTTQSTSVTMALAKLILGVALTTPSNNQVSAVDLWNLRQVMGGKGGF
jgi:hypothetical protein